MSSFGVYTTYSSIPNSGPDNIGGGLGSIVLNRILSSLRLYVDDGPDNIGLYCTKR